MISVMVKNLNQILKEYLGIKMPTDDFEKLWHAPGELDDNKHI